MGSSGFCCLSTWFFAIGSLVIDFKINGTGTLVGWFLFFIGVGYRVALILYIYGIIIWIDYYWMCNYYPEYYLNICYRPSSYYFAMWLSGLLVGFALSVTHIVLLNVQRRQFIMRQARTNSFPNYETC